jgi:uncharacterized protein YkwD
MIAHATRIRRQAGFPSPPPSNILLEPTEILLMKNKSSFQSSILGLIAAATLVSCTHTGVRTAPVAATSPNAALADAVTGSVNSYRLTHGASELKRHAGLDLLARNHSNYMRANRGKFTPNETNATHLGFEGRAMVARRHYYFTNSTETVAAVAKSTSDARSASKLLTLWKESPQDEKAMTNKDWTHTGIGTVTDSDGTVFATQIFGTENIFPSARRERLN